MIPKIIHYVWIGEPNKKVTKCVESWKKYCPDWEIKLWNEENLPMDNIWIKSCYKNRPWGLGFLVDYVKPWVIYNYGGIWLDADVELKEPIDELLKHKNFVFSSIKGDKVATAFMGGEKGSLMFKYIMDTYSNTSFPENVDRRVLNSILLYRRIIAEYGIDILPCVQEACYEYNKGELTVYYTYHVDLYWDWAIHNPTLSWLK